MRQNDEVIWFFNITFMFVVSRSTYQQNNNEAGNEGILLASSNHLFQDNLRIYYVIVEYLNNIYF